MLGLVSGVKDVPICDAEGYAYSLLEYCRCVNELSTDNRQELLSSEWLPKLYLNSCGWSRRLRHNDLHWLGHFFLFVFGFSIECVR